MTKKTDSSSTQKDKEPTISLGNFLQRERQKKKLSTQEIAIATKVPQEALVALESGNKKELPVAVFAKGFVKIYSRYLGLDQNYALKLFQKDWDISSTADTPEMLHEESMAQISPFYMSPQFYVIILTIALFIGLAFFFFNANEETIQTTSLNSIREIQTLPPSINKQETTVSIFLANPPQEQNQPLISPNSAGKLSREEDDNDDIILATLPSVIIVQKQSLGQSVTTQPENSSVSTVDTVQKNVSSIEILPEEIELNSASLDRPLDLHIAFLARTRISISQDDALPAKYIFSSGEESTWSADKSISMQIEEADNIRITLNGKIVPLPKSQGTPLAITLPTDLNNF